MSNITAVDLILKAASVLERQAQATYSGATLADTLRKVPGLTSAFLGFVKKYPEHPENFYLVVSMDLIPENKEAPEGTPPKQWVPRYDRATSTTVVSVRLREQSGKAFSLSGLDKRVLGTLLKFYETPTSNPNPRRAIQRDITIQKIEEINL